MRSSRAGPRPPAREWQPDWVYVSDPLACPAALAIGQLLDTRFIYHEHDSPALDAGTQSAFMRVVLSARRAVAARAALCVLPNDERAEISASRPDVVTESSRCGTVRCVARPA